MHCSLFSHTPVIDHFYSFKTFIFSILDSVSMSDLMYMFCGVNLSFFGGVVDF